jgi:hypothetical protein
MRYILHRAVHYLFGGIGEIVVATALIVVLALCVAGTGPSAWLSDFPDSAFLLIAVALALLLIVLGVRKMLGGNHGSEAHPAPDELDWKIPSYLANAPTFIHYSHATKVSLTKNIRSLVTDGNCNFTFYFLQPIMTETTIVRPFGGTPRFDVVSYSERHLHIRLAEDVDVLKLAILGQIMPVIQNHPDEPAPSIGVFRRSNGSQALRPALARRPLDADLSAANVLAKRSFDS